jgi:hypothetical protein
LTIKTFPETDATEEGLALKVTANPELAVAERVTDWPTITFCILSKEIV